MDFIRNYDYTPVMREIDIALLHSFLSYDEQTGALIWKERDVAEFPTSRAANSWNSRYAGRKAGAFIAGYLTISIGKTRILAHRAIWAMRHGQWPEFKLGHKNGRRDDNRLKNLCVLVPWRLRNK